MRGLSDLGWAVATLALAASNFFLDSSRCLCAFKRAAATSRSFYSLISAYRFYSASLRDLISSTRAAFSRIS